MNLIDQLKILGPGVQIENLEKLLNERSSWIQRESSTLYREQIRALKEFPAKEYFTDFEGAEVVIGKKEELTPEAREKVLQMAKDLIAWRKGPFNFFGEKIDSEWRSDLKWERIEKFLPTLNNKRILDIGCNNGYYLYKMAAQNPKLLLGIDPVLHYQAQFNLLQKFAQAPNLFFELLGIEHLPLFKEFFDVIFSMGIIYHHRHPIQQLLDIREALKPGGSLVLETIGIPGEETYALFPSERYAKMKNVWFVPTLSCFKNWVERARFIDVEIISDTPLLPEEQRLTDWCPPPHQSLEDFLDPENSDLTVEGYPAPRRFSLIAKKRG